MNSSPYSMFLSPQGPRAEAMMRNSIERGKWVFFQNCHLAPSWMPALERLIEHINPDKVCHDACPQSVQARLRHIDACHAAARVFWIINYTIIGL